MLVLSTICAHFLIQNILTQKVPNGAKPQSNGWAYKDVTSEIPNHTVGNKISAVNIINHTFYILNHKDHFPSFRLHLDYIYPSYY